MEGNYRLFRSERILYKANMMKEEASFVKSRIGHV